jgi:predicted nucleic acid-binding protein
VARGVRGLLDTSVVISRDAQQLPDVMAISAATLAELHFGVHLAHDDQARRGRIRRLTEIEARFDPLPIDAPVARSYGALAHGVVSAGRQPRRRIMDLLIAATAHAHGLPLFTRNAEDLVGLEDEIDIRVV